jgi:ribosomal protein S6E (S10)
MSYGTKKKRTVNGEEVSEDVYQAMIHDDLIREKPRNPAPAEPEEGESLFEKIKRKIGKPNLGETIGKNIQNLKK